VACVYGQVNYNNLTDVVLIPSNTYSSERVHESDDQLNLNDGRR